MLAVSARLVTRGTEPSDQSQHKEDGERSSHTLMEYILLKLSALKTPKNPLKKPEGTQAS